MSIPEKTALETSDGKPITPRDLKALERLTISRAKCEYIQETTITDTIEAIDIYKEVLSGLGLTLAKQVHCMEFIHKMN